MKILLALLMSCAAAFGAVTPAVQNDQTTKHVVQPTGFWAAQPSDPGFVGAVREVQTNAVGGGGGGAVDSVNGKVGTVVLTTSDIAEGANSYWTQSRSNGLLNVAVSTNESRAVRFAAGLTLNNGLLLQGGVLGSIVFPYSGIMFESIISGPTNLYFGYSDNLVTLGTDGTFTAPKFSGSGANLTGIPYSALPYDAQPASGNLSNAASAGQNGYLSSSDWTTFNDKISANQTITVSGDATGSGATAIALTVTNVRGSLTNPISGPASNATGGTVTNGLLGGNQTITISGDGTGSGATAISLTVTNVRGALTNAVTGAASNATGGTVTNGLLAAGSVGTAAYSNAPAFVLTNEARAVVITNAGNTISGNGSGITGLTNGLIKIADVVAQTNSNTALLDRDPQTFSGVNKFAQISVTGETNSSLSASALVVSDANKKEVSGNLSGDITTSGGLATTLANIPSISGANLTNQIRTLGITIDGGGSAITTGVKGYIEIPFGCAIQRATLLADQTGSAGIEIDKCTYSQFDAGSTHPVAGDKITSATPPALNNANKSQDTTLSSWITGITAGDILAFNVLSNATCTRLTLVLKAVTQ